MGHLVAFLDCAKLLAWRSFTSPTNSWHLPRDVLGAGGREFKSPRPDHVKYSGPRTCNVVPRGRSLPWRNSKPTASPQDTRTIAFGGQTGHAQNRPARARGTVMICRSWARIRPSVLMVSAPGKQSEGAQGPLDSVRLRAGLGGFVLDGLGGIEHQGDGLADAVSLLAQLLKILGYGSFGRPGRVLGCALRL